MRVLQGLVVLMLVTPISVAVSQRAEPVLRPGARLRWAVEDTVNRASNETRFTYREGRLDSLDGHSLVLGSAGIPRDEIHAAAARESLTRMVYAETLTGFQRHVGMTAVAGFVVGAAVGYLSADFGRPKGLTCVDTGLASFCQDSPARKDARGTRAIAFGLGATLLGAIAGHVIKTENWTPIDVADVRRWLNLE